LRPKFALRAFVMSVAGVSAAMTAGVSAHSEEQEGKPLLYGPPTGMEFHNLPQVDHPVPIRPNRAGVYGFAHAHVFTADLEASLNFYVNILGFEQVMAIQDIYDDPPVNERMNVLLGFENARFRHAMVSMPGGPSYLEHVPQIEFWEVLDVPLDETINAAPHGNVRGKGYNAYMVKDLDALLERMRKANVRFVSEVLTSPGGKSIYVVDPDGQIIELNEFYAEWQGAEGN